MGEADRLSFGQRLERTMPGGFERLTSGAKLPKYHWVKKPVTITFVYYLEIQCVHDRKMTSLEFSQASDMFWAFSALNPDRKLL
jgi:hypothetical protein